MSLSCGLLCFVMVIGGGIDRLMVHLVAGISMFADCYVLLKLWLDFWLG